MPVYVGAQLVGGLVAGAALFGLMHGFDGYSAEGGIGANSFGSEGSGYAMWAAFALEALLTLVFLYVILAVTDERNEFQALMGPLTIGFALAMIHFASMGATGTSVNPARSIGVGVFGGTDAIIQLWLFIVAPLVGAAIAGLTYPLVFGQAPSRSPGRGSASAAAATQQASYAPPATYEQQWNQGQPQQWQAPAAPPQQQWGQQPPTQPWGQPPHPARSPGAAAGAAAGTRRSSGASPPPTPTRPRPSSRRPSAPPQQWGRPIEDDGEDGRTQVRRPD